ncbi:MAG: Ig-like domain-containing protein [Sulfuricella sp.]
MNCRLTISGFFLPLLFAIAAVLSGCGGGGASAGTPTGGTPTTITTTASTAKNVSLAKTAPSVKTDNSDSVTITATVIDVNNAAMSGQTVTFQASSGILAAATAVTDTSGNATVSFQSGAIEKTNRTATITATVSNTTPAVSGTIPVQITGSTLTLAPLSTSVTAGTPATLTATLKDAGTTPVPNQMVRFTIAASSTGSGTLSVASAATNASGVASVSFTGTAAGLVNVLAEWLDSSGATTVSATSAFTVAAAAGSVFQVTTPATSPFAVTLGTTQNIIVNVPATIGSTPVTSIRYATTLGTWQLQGAGQPNCNTLLQKVCTVTRTSATGTQTFVAGNNAGNANVQIDALDATGAVITTAKLVLALSAPASAATQITLQSNVAALTPSSGGTASTATLTATVRDASNNAVGGAPVLFELVNPTGSGEQLEPVIASTSSTGQAQSTFTAGTAPTVQSLQIKATVIGTAITNTTNITVGGTAGSIALGASTTISSNASNTAYSLPITVMVTDSNGTAVNGAVVTLSLWPKYYYKGTRGATNCTVSYVGGRFNNEDVNENLILDPGEDIDGPGGIASPTYYGTPDGVLWPPSSSAGSVPATVTTGADGTATFDWVYLKDYSNWVGARLRARTTVQGTEATTETVMTLAPAAADAAASPCSLPNSPFN